MHIFLDPLPPTTTGSNKRDKFSGDYNTSGRDDNS